MNLHTSLDKVSPGSHTISQKRVLCIDDDVEGGLLRKSILERAGYDVLSCAGAKTGLALFSMFEVHLVVLDYSMPELNGAEVAEKMRQMKPEVPILMLSGQPTPPHGIENRVDGYVIKGEHPQMLLHTIKDLLRRSSLLTASRW